MENDLEKDKRKAEANIAEVLNLLDAAGFKSNECWKTLGLAVGVSPVCLLLNVRLGGIHVGTGKILEVGSQLGIRCEANFRKGLECLRAIPTSCLKGYRRPGIAGNLSNLRRRFASAGLAGVNAPPWLAMMG